MYIYYIYLFNCLFIVVILQTKLLFYIYFKIILISSSISIYLFSNCRLLINFLICCVAPWTVSDLAYKIKRTIIIFTSITTSDMKCLIAISILVDKDEICSGQYWPHRLCRPSWRCVAMMTVWPLTTVFLYCTACSSGNSKTTQMI